MTSVPNCIRKVALRVAGFVEIPFGGTVGRSPEEERAANERSGMTFVPIPQDNPIMMDVGYMCSDPTPPSPESVDWYLEQSMDWLRKNHLTLAEPGDPNGFLVKWSWRETSEEVTHE